MASKPMSEVIQHLRRAVLLRDGAGLTDGQLLEDYISCRNEAALAALVQRHAPMVWGLCRRVLPNYHDAEDAFQATFLVFVRKVASIASKDLLANWLYGVAHQTALKARATAARRKGRERQVPEMPERAVGEQDLWGDLQRVLDQELSRLPDKYRAVVILCDLEGKTRKPGAVHGRAVGGPAALRLLPVRRRPPSVYRQRVRDVRSDAGHRYGCAALPAGVDNQRPNRRRRGPRPATAWGCTHEAPLGLSETRIGPAELSWQRRPRYHEQLHQACPRHLVADKKEARMEEQERDYLLQQVRQLDRSERHCKLTAITLAPALALLVVVGGLSSFLFGMRLQQNTVQLERTRAAEAAAKEKALRQRADENPPKPAEKKKDPEI